MRAFQANDLEQINGWRALRNAPYLPKDLYPPTGLIEPDVAAGFVNFTQTSMALFENFVTNPHAKEDLRKKAMMEIVEGLKKVAYDQGVKWIVAVTNHPKIEQYIEHYQWQKLPYKIFCKEI